MAKVNLVELEKKFVEYIAGFKSQYDDPKIEGYEVEEKDKGLYTTFKHGDYWYTQTLAFDDINKDTDYKNKSFGIRSDDDFWTVAYLPWEYRMLPIATLKNVLWPNQELEMTPDNPSIERKKWEAKRSAKRIVEERSWIEEKRESRRGVPFTYLAREIENVYVKKYILELLNKNDSLYKDVYNFKKKKRKGWLRRVNAYYNMARLIHIGGSCIHYKFNSKEELAEYTKQKEIINKAHEQSKFKGRHTPLTEVEKRIAKKMGRLPITVKLEYSDESNADIEEVNKYRYGEENVIFIRKGEDK